MTFRHRLVRAAPTLARVAATARDERRFAQSKPLPSSLGFTLRGSAHQASGEFEPVEVDYISTQLITADVLVDVGANYGLYTCLAGRRGLPVIAIEPLPANLRLLYQNIEDNGLRDVQVHPVALGNQSGLVTLFGSGTGASLIEGWAGATQRTVVPVHTLDAILTGAGVLDKRLVVKMDVEGSELGVLAGAERALAANATWMLEVNFEHHHPSGRNPDFAAIFQRFWEAGYTATALEGGRTITPDDVTRWLGNDHRDFGGHNYGFARTAT